MSYDPRRIAVAGTDEAGRGPLAGPVVAAAVILSHEQKMILLENGLKDSKKMTAKAREKLFELMGELNVLWRAQAASPHRIDRMNILQASLWCMGRSVERLYVRPEVVLVDGNFKIPFLLTPQRSVVRGDARVPVIAAASVVAKVLRDRAMLALDGKYPQYGFAAHKGYPSQAHRLSLEKYGPCPVHRFTFRGVVSGSETV